MKITFNEKSNFWKIVLEDRIHSLKINDFLVLTGLRDRNDRRFHHISELIFTSKLDDIFLKNGLRNLRKTPLIHSKGNYYKISKVGEKVVNMIRKDEVEVINERNSFLENLKRFLNFEAN
jgi:predicted transcriptional regulator